MPPERSLDLGSCACRASWTNVEQLVGALGDLGRGRCRSSGRRSSRFSRTVSSVSRVSSCGHDAEPGPDLRSRRAAGSSPSTRSSPPVGGETPRSSASSRTCRRRWGRGSRTPPRGAPRRRCPRPPRSRRSASRSPRARIIGVRVAGGRLRRRRVGSGGGPAVDRGRGVERGRGTASNIAPATDSSRCRSAPDVGAGPGLSADDASVRVATGCPGGRRRDGVGPASASRPGPGSRPPSPRPPPAQVGAWAAIAAGRNALVVAPTGSGKTLPRSCGRSTGWPPSPPPEEQQRRCRVLYVSPLKALAVDVERNLRAPLTGIRHTAARLGVPVPDITVGVRSGDTPADERRRLATHAAGHPDHHARVAVPDAHLAGPRGAARRRDGDRRRGARRRRHQARRPPRALARAARRAARRARRSGSACPPRCARSRRSPASSAAAAPVEVVAPPSDKEWDLQVVVPVEDMAELGADRRRRPRGVGRRRGAAHLDLAARRGARRRPRSSSTARRSSSPTPAGSPSG